MPFSRFLYPICLTKLVFDNEFRFRDPIITCQLLLVDIKSRPILWEHPPRMEIFGGDLPFVCFGGFIDIFGKEARKFGVEP